MAMPPPATKLGITFTISKILIRLPDELRAYQARRSRQDIENYNSQHAHGSVTGNSDGNLPSDRSSQVQRRRSLLPLMMIRGGGTIQGLRWAVRGVCLRFVACLAATPQPANGV
ncbi:hypothetical protein N7516_000460 [Penicillium verrucosum]|uniref:uncharacterized protein n=1 Tax=Penicillium verrucosum TaxID=60171 RepID=UPI002545A154|nr:uncharacterized protein N7516_000460 [Penicillium verrucosum]KAJ5940292.1 hypothetical protein N7516_000460 [Penicillium verrucosum]